MASVFRDGQLGWGGLDRLPGEILDNQQRLVTVGDEGGREAAVRPACATRISMGAEQDQVDVLLKSHLLQLRGDVLIDQQADLSGQRQSLAKVLQAADGLLTVSLGES